MIETLRTIAVCLVAIFAIWMMIKLYRVHDE